MAHDESDKPLCLLALDGGGIRGLSELVVLEEIMKRIKYILNADEDLLPADFFDLIGGTSTGGLIALLLGRLRLSVKSAKQAFVHISKEVFTVRNYLKQHSFNAKKLENEIRQLLGESAGEEKMIENEPNPSCKVFVCTVLQRNARARTGPRLFRTYEVYKNASYNCKIWEACRATSAAPTYFDPIDIGPEGLQETFVDGGLGYNNPVEYLLEEASRIFPKRKVGCVVSIGTGIASVVEFPKSPKTSPITLIEALKEMMTESDSIAERMSGRFTNVRNTYFRFSVDRGLQGIGLEEWKEQPHVHSLTTEYIGLHDISKQVDQVVRILLTSKMVEQKGSVSLVRSPRLVSANIEASHASARTLEWQPPEGPLPSFPHTTEQFASRVMISIPPRNYTVPLPFDRNQDFVGRDKEIAELLKKIPPVASKDSCQKTVLYGLGGIGKTQIALEAAYQVRYTYPECRTFWVSAVNASAFENAYLQIGQKLQIQGIGNDNADIKALVKAALSQSHDYWLIIVDNADDMGLLFGDASLYSHLPSSHKGSILITTRTREVVSRLDIPRDNVVHIKEMKRSEAIELMKKNVTEEQMRDSKSTETLLNLLADHPLAVKQASAYMDETGRSTTEYLERCRSSDKTFIKLLSKRFNDRGRLESSQNPVATTWLVSFSHIDRDNAAAAQCLKYISFLSEKDIPESLLFSGDNASDIDEVISILRAYAFVSRRADRKSYDVHRLVSLAMRNWLDQMGKLESCVTALIQHLAEKYPPTTYENREIWARYLPHATAALEFRDSSTDEVSKSCLLHRIASSNFNLGNYRNAETLYRDTLTHIRRVSSDNHVDVFEVMIRLARTLHGLRKDKEAERMYHDAFALEIEDLGDEHPIMLDAMNGRANLLSDQREYEEAEALHLKTLALQRQAFGHGDSSTLASMDSLANCFLHQGKHDEAEAIIIEALELAKPLFSDENPFLSHFLGTFSSILSAKGKYNEAEEICRKTLAVMKRAFGDKYPSTIISMFSLAANCSKQENYAEAEELYLKALGLMNLVFGDKHPTTLDCMHDFASTLLHQGKYEEAEVILRKTLALRKQVLGDEDPETLKSMNNLAFALDNQGRYEDAKSAYCEAITCYKRAIGNENSETWSIMNNLAVMLANQGRYADAGVIYHEIFTLRERVLGDEHPDTRSSMDSLKTMIILQALLRR